MKEILLIKSDSQPSDMKDLCPPAFNMITGAYYFLYAYILASEKMNYAFFLFPPVIFAMLYWTLWRNFLLKEFLYYAIKQVHTLGEPNNYNNQPHKYVCAREYLYYEMPPHHKAAAKREKKISNKSKMECECI